MANAAPEQPEVLAACISLWRTFAHLLLTHFSGVLRVSSRIFNFIQYCIGPLTIC